ncbi:MAG: chemotaxis protein CheW [Desulfococcaceae bacterium]|jgi:purine-binding chemotaxis protein CheW|nr:chemotaxis protein CheW [Desulfococcaceae bacterium]
MDSTEKSGTNQYLTFTLEDENFALEIGKVREVLDYTGITRVPRMPDFLRGVINLRGNVVPVIDLRLKMGMTAIEKTIDSCIVIAEITIDGELTQVGALTDSVKEVISLDSNRISPPPRLGMKLKNEFIRGMGKLDDGFLIILDIDKVLSEDDLAIVKDSESAELPEKDAKEAGDAEDGKEDADDSKDREIPKNRPVLDLDAPDPDDSDP